MSIIYLKKITENVFLFLLIIFLFKKLNDINKFNQINESIKYRFQ